MTASSKLHLLARGITKRCANCGGADLFRHWFTMADDCLRCGHHFERDPGYWLGAMIINTAVVIGVFLAGFVGVAWLTWPEVPWTGILIGTIAANVAVPVLFYPFSKTLFVALDLAVRPLTDDERSAARERIGGMSQVEA